MVYKREGYDILSYLADIGGILDLLHLAFTYIVSLLASKLMRAAIISSAYRVKESKVSDLRMDEILSADTN